MTVDISPKTTLSGRTGMGIKVGRLRALPRALVKSKLLEGEYADGRRLALFHDLKDVKVNKKEIEKIVKALVGHIKKS